jgi:sugar lactone lactonase YvrE
VTTATVLRPGLRFGEAPRWHDGRLWYSDFYDLAVHTLTLDGHDERRFEVPGQPSGLGWLPDGTLVVSSMTDRRVLRHDGTRLVPHADLGSLAGWWVNDLVVDRHGRAYVGNFGFDLDAFLAQHGLAGILGDPGPPTTVLCRVDPDGSVTVAADEMVFPNGAVVTPDGCTLVVAETLAFRLTAFTVAADGSLSERRVWADLSAHPAVAEGGVVLDTVRTSQPAFACALGGPDLRHLFVTTAPDPTPAHRRVATEGAVEVAVVDVPGVA